MLLTVLKYLGFLKYLGGPANPVMPLIIILRCLFSLHLFIGHDRDRSILEWYASIRQKYFFFFLLFFFCAELGSTALTLASSQDKMISYYIKAGLKNLRSKWSQMICAAEYSTVATETEHQTPLSCYRNIPPSVCLNTPTHVEELWGGVLCMKMKTMTKTYH